jgi:hypothetical protein
MILKLLMPHVAKVTTSWVKVACGRNHTLFHKIEGIYVQQVNKWCDHIIHKAGAAIGKTSALLWFIAYDPAIENEQSWGAAKV